MTENQIKYILQRHRKYLSIWFGITEQAVFKWQQRLKIPEKYFDAIEKTDVSGFFEFIKDRMISDIENKINIEMKAVYGVENDN